MSRRCMTTHSFERTFAFALQACQESLFRIKRPITYTSTVVHSSISDIATYLLCQEQHSIPSSSLKSVWPSCSHSPCSASSSLHRNPRNSHLDTCTPNTKHVKTNNKQKSFPFPNTRVQTKTQTKSKQLVAWDLAKFCFVLFLFNSSSATIASHQSQPLIVVLTSGAIKPLYICALPVQFSWVIGM